MGQDAALQVGVKFLHHIRGQAFGGGIGGKGGLANHRHEPWKLPLPEFIAECYRQRLHRERPAQVVPLAEVTKRQQPSVRDKPRHPPERTDA